MDSNSLHKVIVFGGGCFWCTEAVFKELRGVISVMPGYAGGIPPPPGADGAQSPTYEQVCTGKTGYAEVIRIEYDPAAVRFHDLLTVFFATHDPTTLNRQGNDVGTQYRSVVFYTTAEQKKEAEDFITGLNASSLHGAQIITAVEPLEKFYEAEQYHRDYYEKNKSQPYCQIVINPKLEKVQKEFTALLKKNSIL